MGPSQSSVLSFKGKRIDILPDVFTDSPCDGCEVPGVSVKRSMGRGSALAVHTLAIVNKDTNCALQSTLNHFDYVV